MYIGEIKYGSGQVCRLTVPANVSEQYQIGYEGMQPLDGLLLPSHVQPFSYQTIQNIPTDPKTSSQHFQDYQNLVRQVYSASSIRNPALVIKSSIVALATFGYGNQAVSANQDFIEVFEKLQAALRIMLPPELGFQRLEVRIPDVVLITDSGTFSLDSASGGVAALVGIAWQLSMYGADKAGFVTVMDEPENHLHPAMQRELLPNLQHAFPDTQFVISTHSPFVVTSDQNARVYALEFVDGRVASKRLETPDLSGDYSETLRNILDVPITIPKWVEQTVADLYREMKLSGITEESVERLRSQLEELGLLPSFFSAIQEIERDQDEKSH